MVAFSGIAGCCAGRNIYNLGGAHGHITYKDQDAFDNAMERVTPLAINIAITNSNQSKTREYLNNSGWKTEKVGNLWISTISGSEFRKYREERRLRKKKTEFQLTPELIAKGPPILSVNGPTWVDIQALAGEVFEVTPRLTTPFSDTRVTLAQLERLFALINRRWYITMPVPTRNMLAHRDWGMWWERRQYAWSLDSVLRSAIARFAAAKSRARKDYVKELTAKNVPAEATAATRFAIPTASTN